MDSKTVEIDNRPVTKQVTFLVSNTHCFVCGRAFNVPRVGRLYCSIRCKQYAYNNKQKIRDVLDAKDRGLNQMPIVIKLSEYTYYIDLCKKQKRLKELKKKNMSWQAADQEIRERDKLLIPVSNYLYDTYASKKLSADEYYELEIIENELDKKYGILDLQELSIEQWTFIKSLQPKLNKTDFIKFISSLGSDFIEQLSLTQDLSNSKSVNMMIIQNKLINHCNMIALGFVSFGTKNK